MFDFIKAIVLGIVQGATEFIPVSSSAHLVIVPWLLGWQPSSLLFDTMLHWGTLVSIFVVFWRDFLAIIVATVRSILTRSLADVNARLGWMIVLGSIPAALLGFLFKDFFEALFASPFAAGAFLFVTAGLLIGSEVLTRRLVAPRDLTALTFGDAAIIGLAQAAALPPGISRSGSTIATALARGIRRDAAARFSFLLGTPAFFGAGLLALLDAMAESQNISGQIPVFVVGFLVSAISGVLAIRFLLAYLRTRTLYLFAIYCLLMGSFVVGWHLLN